MVLLRLFFIPIHFLIIGYIVFQGYISNGKYFGKLNWLLIAKTFKFKGARNKVKIKSGENFSQPECAEIYTNKVILRAVDGSKSYPNDAVTSLLSRFCRGKGLMINKYF